MIMTNKAKESQSDGKANSLEDVASENVPEEAPAGNTTTRTVL
jgi:hypothetical protein